MWRIGIIDDKEGERADIQVSILENVERKEEVEFKEYEIERREKEDLLKEILNDITEENIQTLIIDYRLDTSMMVIKGWEIADFVHNEIPEFPVIIMTNVPEESKESPYIDADKVYPKIIFLNTRHEDTPGMVKNIMLNIQRYIKRRNDLEGKLRLELKKLDQNSTDDEVISNILEIEQTLSKYKETEQTILDQTFDLGELKEVLEDIKDINKLLGE